MSEMNLIHGECLEEMAKLPDGSVDMVLTDPPYGTTACKWDSVIPFEPMWEQLKRITKKNGAIVLTASQPFTSALIMSNVKMFKYCWVWDKKLAANFLAAKKMPLLRTEDVCIFSMGGANNGAKVPMEYFPQMVARDKPRKGVLNRTGNAKNPKYHHLKNDNHKEAEVVWDKKYPTNLIEIPNTKRKKAESHHPTQKPVALMEYLIKTYTNEGETVLDFCFGSCTTGVACKNLNRDFIGIELDDAYFKIAEKRINEDV